MGEGLLYLIITFYNYNKQQLVFPIYHTNNLCQPLNPKLMKELIYLAAFLASVLIVSTIIRPPEFKDKNCGDFKTQAEAMEEFKKWDTDVHRLDGDGDGIICENLPTN